MTSSRCRISSGFERRVRLLCVAVLSLSFAVSANAQKPAPTKPAKERVDVGAWGEVTSTGSDPETSDVVETIDLGDAPSGESTGEDTVEIVDLGDGTPPSAGTSHSESPASEQASFQLRGWARTRISQGIVGDGSEDSRDGLRVPFEPTLSDHQLFVELRYEHARTFEALVSGLLWYTLALHEEDDARGVIESSARGLFEPSLREAYVGAHGKKASLRIGQQRIAWGNSDAFAINDVINPRDLRDPVLAESEVFHIPSFAVRLDIPADVVALQLLLTPFFRPDRVDVYGTNWALVQPSAPAGIRGAFRRLSETVDPSLREPSQLALRQTSLPEDNLSALGAGARLDWSRGDLNVSHYYHYGYTFSPALTIAPALFAQIAATRWETADAQALAPVLAAAGTDALSSTYVRRHHLGLSLQTGVGPVLVRAEGAYESAQVFTTQALLGVTRPTAQAVLGLEYQPGEQGKALIFEAAYQRVLGDDPGPLLGAAVSAPSAAAVLRWTFFEVLECELRAVSSLNPHGALLRPQLAYKKSDWDLRLGAAWLNGERGSQQQYFHRNTSLYAMVKRAF